MHKGLSLPIWPVRWFPHLLYQPQFPVMFIALPLVSVPGQSCKGCKMRLKSSPLVPASFSFSFSPQSVPTVLYSKASVTNRWSLRSKKLVLKVLRGDLWKRIQRILWCPRDALKGQHPISHFLGKPAKERFQKHLLLQKALNIRKLFHLSLCQLPWSNSNQWLANAGIQKPNSQPPLKHSKGPSQL